jgi:SPP1 gp7 family putative phage head morphogenesis protein
MTGKKFGCYATKSQAEKRLAQIHAFSTANANVKEKKKEMVIDERINLYSKLSHIFESVDNDFIKVNEWLNLDITPYKQIIINTIKNDDFIDLRALTKQEEIAGYLNGNEINKLKSIFSLAVMNNYTLSEIKTLIKENVNVRDLLKLEESKGVILHKMKRIDLIAKTELTRLLNKALLKVYERNEDIILRWDATIDERTCPICRELNRKIFSGDELTQEMVPPIHPNCRCSLEEVKINRESLKKMVDDGKAPQEIEAILTKYGLDEKQTKKFVESLVRIKNERKA